MEGSGGTWQWEVGRGKQEEEVCGRPGEGGGSQTGKARSLGERREGRPMRSFTVKRERQVARRYSKVERTVV